MVVGVVNTWLIVWRLVICGATRGVQEDKQSVS